MRTQAHLTPRALEMFAVIEKYQAGGLRQKAFCRQEKLKYPTFQYWLKKYRQAQANPPKASTVIDESIHPTDNYAGFNQQVC